VVAALILTRVLSSFSLLLYGVGASDPVTSYIKECQEKNLPLGSMPAVFCFGIQPNCLNVHSYSESGLPQAKGFGSFPRVKRRINSSSLWFHFRCCDGASRFLKQQA